MLKKAMKMQVLPGEQDNIWKVISTRKKKEILEETIYTVIQTEQDYMCDCENSDKTIYCSHILAIIYRRNILKFREYMENVPHKNINYHKVLDRSVKHELNVLKIGDNEGVKHQMYKKLVFNYLRAKNKDIICEAKFSEEFGYGEADIYNVTDGQIIEILSMETIESFKKVKVSKFPWHLKLDFIKIHKDKIETSQGLKQTNIQY